MSYFDVVLKGGRVVDPARRTDAICDIGIRDGRIACVAASLAESDADHTIDVSGKLVMPGIVDCHVHVSEWLGGRAGHRMLAASGVITAIDHAGPIEEVFRTTRDHGAGLNLACINGVIPGRTVRDREPSRSELDAMIAASLDGGALGVKILGGHYPLSPEASGRVIEAANAAHAYISYHIGTVANPDNDLNALRQALEIAGSNRLHLPHVNSYCRGYVLGDPFLEIRQALDLIAAAPNVVAESHLSIWNGTSGACIAEVPESNVTKKCLRLGQYPVSEAGLRQAILDDFARTIVEVDGQNVPIGGREGIEAWEKAGTHAVVSFPVNVAASLLACATQRDACGDFIVDAIASDGGGIPRNNLVRAGLALVRFGAFTLQDWIRKVSTTPARMFGLRQKGHLGEGADADVTVVDLRTEEAVLGIAQGNIIMIDGKSIGRGGTFITTPRGRAAVEAMGFRTSLVHLEDTQLYAGSQREE